MRLSELRARLEQLNAEGFVPSERAGPTGIGHTLETRLGLTENNLPIPDMGGRTEIKATRTGSNNLITLFTFNRGAWSHTRKEVINRWGYVDRNGRPSLYSTVSAKEPNGQDLQLFVSQDATTVSLKHAPTDHVLATWDLFHIVGQFVIKFRRLLLVHADSRRANGIEEFHYNRAHLLADPNSLTLRDGFADGSVSIDVRMHLRSNGQARDHGTAFRVMEHNLPKLFGTIERIV